MRGPVRQALRLSADLPLQVEWVDNGPGWLAAWVDPAPKQSWLLVAPVVWVMLAIAPEFARLLLWPARLYADYSPQMVPVLTFPSPGHANGALLVLCLIVLAIVSAKRFPLATFALAWLAVTVAPTANILIPTGILLAERTLFLPSVGVMLVVAAVVPWCLRQVRSAPPSARLGAAGVLAIVLVAGASRSAERQRAWKDSSTVFRTLAADAPDSFKAHYANGGMLWEAKRPGEAERGRGAQQRDRAQPDGDEDAELEPTAGFFFGDTEKNEWYFDELRNTIQGLDKVLTLPPSYEFYYRASW